jgi:hypothetical protein
MDRRQGRATWDGRAALTEVAECALLFRPTFAGHRRGLARAAPVSRLRPRRRPIASASAASPATGYQSRFEPMTGTLETFVTLAAIQLAIRRLART